MTERSQARDPQKPEALQDFASRHLLRAILKGDLAPGDKLSPSKIAEQLNISHIPVREALAGMEASGHVTRVPRVGFFVVERNLADVDDVYHWRQVLEDEAHRIAIPNLTAADLRRMRRANKAAAASSAFGPRYLELNREFHFVPFQKAGSPILIRFLNHLWDASARHQNALSTVGLSSTLFQEQHEHIVDAFEARDLALVNSRMAEHRLLTVRAVRELVAAAGKGPPEMHSA